MKDFLIELTPVYSLEVLSALLGFYFIILGKKSTHQKLFVAFLWFIMLTESYGMMTAIAYYSDYTWFSFLKDNFFSRNEWAYNIYSTIQMVFIPWYFSNYISQKWMRISMNIIGALAFLTYFGFMFKYSSLDFYNSPFLSILGGLSILTCGFIVLIEILKSDKVLKLTSFFPFYVAIGYIVYTLITTPLFIYGKYFNQMNTFFVEFRGWVFWIVNVFLYSLFSFAYIKCYRKKNSD
jgi:hypothetical protein